MSQELDWEKEFSDRFYEFTGTLPLIRSGKLPLRDMQAARLTNINRQWWFYYPLSRLRSTDWYDFLAIAELYPEVQVDISTAEQLSEAIGIPVDQRNMPDLWVMCLEVFPK